MTVAALTPPDHRLSFAATLISATPQCVFFHSKLASLSLRSTPKVGPIRMGGKTYPGGVSQAVWRRTQLRKRKKLKREGLALESQIYQRRKRAELQSATAVLELPLESVDKAPKLSPKSDEEQLKVLSDRFQKPDGTEMRRSGNRLPSARFYPKRVNQLDDSAEDLVQKFYSNDEEFEEDNYLSRRSGKFDYRMKGLLSVDESDDELELKPLGANRFQKSGGAELLRTSNGLPSARFHPKWVNQSDNPVENMVQEGGSDDDDEEIKEDIYLSSRMESRSGNSNYLMKDLLFDDESDDELDTEGDDTDVYEWNRRNSGRTMRGNVNTLGLKKMNSENGGSRIRSNSRVDTGHWTLEKFDSLSGHWTGRFRFWSNQKETDRVELKELWNSLVEFRHP